MNVLFITFIRVTFWELWTTPFTLRKKQKESRKTDNCFTSQTLEYTVPVYYGDDSVLFKNTQSTEMTEDEE